MIRKNLRDINRAYEGNVTIQIRYFNIRYKLKPVAQSLPLQLLPCCLKLTTYALALLPAVCILIDLLLGASRHRLQIRTHNLSSLCSKPRRGKGSLT